MLFQWYTTLLFINFFFFFLNRICILFLLSLILYMLVYVFCKYFDIHIDVILEYRFISRVCALFYVSLMIYCGFYLLSFDYYRALRILYCDVEYLNMLDTFDFESFYIFFDIEILCSFFNFDYAFFYVSFDDFIVVMSKFREIYDSFMFDYSIYINIFKVFLRCFLLSFLKYLKKKKKK